MTREQFKARATTLQMLKVQAEMIKAQIEEIEAEIKADMTATGENVVEDDDYRFRFTDYTTRGLDSEATERRAAGYLCGVHDGQSGQAVQLLYLHLIIQPCR